MARRPSCRLLLQDFTCRFVPPPRLSKARATWFLGAGIAPPFFGLRHGGGIVFLHPIPRRFREHDVGAFDFWCVLVLNTGNFHVGAKFLELGNLLLSDFVRLEVIKQSDAAQFGHSVCVVFNTCTANLAGRLRDAIWQFHETSLSAFAVVIKRQAPRLSQNREKQS